MISLHGAYENENFGDELLIAIQAKWISELKKEVCLPFAVDVYREQIPCTDNKGIEGLLASEKLIYTGGGYFGEPNYKKIKWGINFFRKKHNLPSKIFRKNNKEYIVCGVGAGPVTNIFTRKSIVNICNNAKRVLVRDKESFDYLIEYGVNKDKLILAADVVLSLIDEQLPQEAYIKIDKTLKKENGKLYFGIHIGVSPNDPFYNEKVRILLNAIESIVNTRNDIVPVLIADKRNASTNQEVSIDYLKNKLKTPPIVYKHSDIWETCALLADLDAVITTKLHVGITSYAFKTKTFGVAAHQKTKRFYKQIGKEKYFSDLIDIDNDIKDKLIAFLDDKKYWDNETEVKRNFLKSQALVCKKEMTEFIKD